jgi:type VI secretion system protein ImpG
VDPRLLGHYEEELKFIREMALEFAREYPKVAGRLAIDGVEAKECADPYVERLLEGAAFLTARIQLQLKLEHPRFTEQLLRAIYPSFLAPTPSMVVVEFKPQADADGLASGHRIARGSPVNGLTSKELPTPVRFTTAHDVTLWPIELAQARYYGTAAGLGLAGIRDLGSARAGLRLTLRVNAGLKAAELKLDRLDIYLSGAESLPRQLYEHLFAHGLGFVISGKEGTQQTVRGVDSVRQVGFSDGEALLPPSRREFSGYRLLQEYFALPERFLFVRFEGLRAGMAAIDAPEFDLTVLFDRPIPTLEALVSKENFRLFATPAINLIERRADRISLDDRVPEYHLVVERSRPMDFEVYDVQSAEGFGTNVEPDVKFQPLYGTTEATWHAHDRAFFTLRREPRMLSAKQTRFGPRSSYIGSEIFLSLTDATAAPFKSSLQQLECMVRCTNRDLPLMMPVGRGTTDFQLDSGAPIESIRLAAGPSRPKPPLSISQNAWRLISHLSLNYNSLLEGSREGGASALREMLTLYSDPNDPSQQRQIEGLQGIASSPIVARLPIAGPVAVGRGNEVVVTLDDRSFEGAGVFLLGSVLEEFFARYVSINSFTRTVLRTVDRGEVKRWPPRTGRRPAI